MYLQTKRLILREYEFGDEHLMFELDSDPDVTKYVSNDHNPIELYEAAIIRYLNFYKEGHNCGYYKVYLKDEPNEYIGWFHLRPEKHDPKNFKVLELGYRFKKQYWNKGYATEGTKALIEKSFKELNAELVSAFTMKTNLASRRVMEKSGLVLDEFAENINKEYSVRYTLSKDLYEK